MLCLKCWKESKYEFCRDCKEVKRNAWAMVSQNKKKLIKLFMGRRLTPQWFEKFLLYSNNIVKYGKIYMEYQNVKEYKVIKIISEATMFISIIIAARSWLSIFIIRL